MTRHTTKNANGSHADATRRRASLQPLSDHVHLEVDLLRGPGEAADERREAGTTNAYRVLVVDDDRDMRDYVQRCLKSLQLDLEIAEACDGVEALARVRRGDVALVISDVVMPRLDGLELCRAIRGDASLRHVLVLLVTGELSARDVEERTRRSEPHAVLTKPFNAQKLGHTVVRLLGRAPPQPPTGDS